MSMTSLDMCSPIMHVTYSSAHALRASVLVGMLYILRSAAYAEIDFILVAGYINCT
jgi:hypothetical protein